MVDMSYDHILEVPDTPDRVQQSTCSVSSYGARRDTTMATANSYCHSKIKIKLTNISMHDPSSQGDGVLAEPTDADHIFRQAEEARTLALLEDFEAKLSSQKSDRTTSTSLENEKRTEQRGLDVSSSISNHTSCSGTGGRSASCQIRLDGKVTQQDANNRNANFRGVGSSLPTFPVGKPRNRTCTSTTNRLKVVAGGDVCPGSSSREVNSEVISNKAIAGPSRSPFVPQRRVGQKKLVRNGCISPSNVSKRTVKVDQKQEMSSPSGVLRHSHPQFDVSGKINVIDLTDNSPTITRQGNTVNDRLISANNVNTRAAKRLRTDRAGKILIPPSEYHATGSNYSGVSLLDYNNKGKEISHDILDGNRIGEANSRRVCQSAAGNSSVVNNSSSGLDIKQGWRTTHNYTGGNNSINGATTIRPESSRNRKISIAREKRKHASSSSHPGGSSSALDEPGSSFLASSETTASRNHTTHRHDIPVITIDDIFPEVRPSSSGYSNGTSVDPTIQAQLESDELLARQLQEQLYNESARVAPTEEIDAAVAMSLQHEEDVHRTSRAGRWYENEHRTSRAIRQYEDVPRTSRVVRRSQYNTRGAQTSRSNAYQDVIESANDMISHLQNAASITLGLGAVFPRYPGVPHLQPNIDLNDYDALLALDENNHQHTGASESQINNLPQSVVQSNSIEEPCVVCLENPSVGDTIRHLPCFHKFHKECIDEWLKRKKLCPICKTGIR